jgi:hypothetical protein
LEAANWLHTITTSPSLPFAASTTASNKHEEDIIALAGLLKNQTGSMKKKVFSSSSSVDQHGHNRQPRQNPPWKYYAPTDPTEVIL